MTVSSARLPLGVAVSWRPPGVLHVDLPDGRTLRCESVPAGVGAAAALLDGTRSPLLVATQAGIAPEWVGWLLSTVAEAGATCPPPSSSVVEVRGCGRVGTAVAELLLSVGTPVVLADDEPAPDTAVTGWTRADALHARLTGRERAGTRSWVRHRAHPYPTPELVVLVGERAECDRAETDTLLREDRPHLVTSFVGSAAGVGPLVIPGRTACLRCGDLAATEADASWPERLAVRSGRPARPSPFARAWVTATVVAQVLAWTTHGTPDALGTVIELDTADGRLRSRRWPVHPACGCLAS
ncbi:hypothetical protein [Propionicicella superfundia]|uniref:hypothetical protein n=1 Tax=Propionicicella superfundia TaxID=348582 RepID=UPI0009FD509F|nr:hypothetical protein [Propionicicella superfundia]